MSKRPREEPARPKKSFVFFWRETEADYGIFSNWHFSLFEMELCDGKSRLFYCGEQAIMAEKALLFKDGEMFAKIMQDGKYDRTFSSFKKGSKKIYTPRYLKRLGRKVANFDAEVWSAHISDLATKICIAKFSPSDERAHAKLLETGSAHIAEASPYDRIWGIGYKASTAHRHNYYLWGNNILGKGLMNARSHYLNAK